MDYVVDGNVRRLNKMKWSPQFLERSVLQGRAAAPCATLRVERVMIGINLRLTATMLPFTRQHGAYNSLSCARMDFVMVVLAGSSTMFWKNKSLSPS